MFINNKKSNWKPKKGSFRKIQENFIKEALYGKLNEAEVDPDQMIKFKSSDGENKEMAASSAKKMAKDHPAKIAYDKLAGGGDDGEDSKPGVNIFDKPEPDGPDDGGEGSDDDWDRDPSLEPGDDGGDYAKPGDDDWDDPVDPSSFAGNATSDGWSQKAQKAKDDLEGLNKWGAPPDEIGDWIEDNKETLSGGKSGRAADLEFAPVQKAHAELEDAYTAAEEEGDWDAYDKAKEDFTKLIDKKLESTDADNEDTMDNLKWGDAEFEPDTNRQAKHWDDESNWSDDNKELRRSIDNSGASYYLKDPTRLQNFKNNPKSAAKLMKDKNWPPEVVQHMKDIGALPSDDEPKVPAPDSRSDTGKPRVSANPYDDNFGQEVDDNPSKMFDDMDIGYEETEDANGNKKYELEDGRELTFTDKGVMIDDDGNEEIDQWPYPPENWGYETVEDEDGRDVPVVPHDQWKEESQDYLGKRFPEESFIGKRGVAAEGSFRKIQEQWVKKNIL